MMTMRNEGAAPLLEVNNLHVSFATYGGRVQAVRGLILPSIQERRWRSSGSLEAVRV